MNLTDGLDGLAIGCTIIAAGALTVLTYVSGHAVFADYLELQRMPLVGELTVFCGSMVGASIGFLWYNAHPAEVFMGDVGSLALGGAIGTVAVIIKQELLLPFIGGIFVLEALSGHPAGGQLQAAQEAHLQDGSAAPSLRADGLVGVEGDRAFLDRRAGLCALCAHHAQAALTTADVHNNLSGSGTDRGVLSRWNFKGKKVLVVGLGKSGLAAALFLRRRGAQVTVSDVRSADALAKDIPALLEAGIAVEAGGHGLLTFRRQDLIVVSPGVPLDTPELVQVRNFGLPVIGELELAARFLKGKMLAITGSNGKTTTTSLCGEIFAAGGLARPGRRQYRRAGHRAGRGRRATTAGRCSRFPASSWRPRRVSSAISP